MVAPASTRITSPYGESEDYDGWHNGIDFAWDVWGNTPVVAFQAGLVTFVGVYPGWGGRGTVVVIDHGNGVVSWSCHLAGVNVSHGDWVSEGQRVGTMGATGYTYGVHLHWMIYLNGRVVDPTPYLTGTAGGGISPLPDYSKDNETMRHLWRYTSANPHVYIAVDHLNMTYRVIPAASLEEAAINNDINAGFARCDIISDPAWGDLFGNGQFRQITTPNPIPSGGSGGGSGVTRAEVDKIVADSEKRVIAKIPTATQNGTAAREAIVKKES